MMSNPLLLAHRGHWHGHCVENTLPAFHRTLQRVSSECHGLECDWQQLDDEIPESWIVFHDKTIQRLSNNNSQFPPTPGIALFQYGHVGRLPTLSDICDWIQTISGPMIMNIELKSGTPKGLRYLIHALNNANNNGAVTFIYSSFDPAIMATLFRLNTIQISGLIRQFEDLDQWPDADHRIQFMAMRHDAITSKIQAAIAQKGYLLGVYFSDQLSYQTHRVDVLKWPNLGAVFTES
jgi:glycerophosphoryl diester phosphodiesterase